MDRFEEALTGLGITDNRSKETIAPLLKSFLESSIALQRALTPINGSVHAAVSRATNHEEELMTSIDWVSVYDRVGLFDVDDRHVARLIDAALRHVWRKEESDFIIGSVGECCNWQGLSPVLMPLTGLAPASPHFGLRAMGRLSFPK